MEFQTDIYKHSRVYSTLVVNLFGGPGTGKSTTAAELFAKMKHDGQNVELAHEYAKDLTWEKRMDALAFQPYVAAKQMYRVHRLLGQVDVVITDSPILLSCIYGEKSYLTNLHSEFLLETFRSWTTANFFLQRDLEHHPYNPSGRNQTEEEAILIDQQIDEFLYKNSIPTEHVMIGEDTSDIIFKLVKEKLHGK